MQAGQIYRTVRDRFRAAGLPAADMDARLLVGSVLKMNLSDLVLNDTLLIAGEVIQEIQDKASLRLDGMPVGRILGEREFYGRRFRLNGATLEPRPDTEILVDAVLERSSADRPLLICDVGTGSGAIAVSLLAEHEQCSVIAIDLVEDALACTCANASQHGVGDRLFPLCANYLTALATGDEVSLDWIVSNPPYIRTEVLSKLEPEVTQHDPMLALDGGESGLEAFVSIVTDAAKLLASGGRIGLEIGYDQAEDVEKQLRLHGFGAIEIIKDLAGNDRVVVARKQ